MYAYHVLTGGQSVVQRLAPNGRGFTTYREISGMVDSGPAAGVRFDILVPADSANVDSIRAAIEAEVEHLSAVASLGGPVG